MVLANLHFLSRLCGKPVNVNSLPTQASGKAPLAINDKTALNFCGLPTNLNFHPCATA